MSLPKPAAFITSFGLYSEVKFQELETWDLIDILYYSGSYDAYCVECQRESTFKVDSKTIPEDLGRDIAFRHSPRNQGVKVPVHRPAFGLYIIESGCSRNPYHRQEFVCHIRPERAAVGDGQTELSYVLQKIGQRPSYADLHIAQTKKYSHVLPKASLQEFSKAIGLASHGIGVGSYVYLRRIFEGLIEEAHVKAQKEADWDEGKYVSARVGERVELLRMHLPEFLVQNKGIYSLLSKGVHELSEDDCLKHFEALKLGIELILDERHEARERLRKISLATAALQKAASEIAK